MIESDSDGGSVQQLREAEKGARKKRRKKSEKDKKRIKQDEFFPETDN